MQGKLLIDDDKFPQILRDFVPDLGVLYFEGDPGLLQNRKQPEKARSNPKKVGRFGRRKKRIMEN